MIKLQQKEYDMNFLLSFSFDFSLLKEVLINLLKSNQDLEQRIKKLEKSNKIKDKHILNLEEKLQIEYTPEEDNLFIIENMNKTSEEYEYNTSNVNKETKSIKNKEKEEEYNNNDEKEEIDNKNNKIKRSNSISIFRKDFDNININSLASNQVSDEVIRSILKLIKENSEKINKLEKNLNKKISIPYTNLEKKIKEIDSKNLKEHKILDAKITDINNRLSNINDKTDRLIVKTAPLDTLSMFKDNGNGTVDATKVMIQILEEKINKRFELLETKNKNIYNEQDQNTDTDKEIGSTNINPEKKSQRDQKIDELEKIINQLNKDIDSLKQNRNINNAENNYDDVIKELKEFIDNQNHDLLVIIEELSNKLKNGDFVGEKMDDFLKKLNNEKGKKSQITKKSSRKKTNKSNNIEGKEVDNNIISELKGRIKDLNKKINEIENNFIKLMNNQGQNINEIKLEIIGLKENLETKITKDDLKTLNTITQENSDELKFMQDKISDLIESIQKLQDNNPNIIKRLESLTQDFLILKEKSGKDAESKPMDLSRYIDENKIKNILKPYKKNIDILMFEKDSLYNYIKDIKDQIKYLETKEKVNMFNEELNEKLNELINKIKKKYLDKNEVNKLIKKLDLQIKLLSDNQKNKDADTWILAKQPVGCFNCASCEANIKNLSPQDEFCPWNRYPNGEKHFKHLGQGFSKLLQRISESGIKRDLSPENDSENNLYSSMTNINGNKNIVLKINHRENIKDDFKENLFKFNKKYKLPKVFGKKRKKSSKIEELPLIDEENDNKSYESLNLNSPKITKITKKKISDLSEQILINSKRKSLIVDTNNKNDFSSNRHSSKLERVKSLPIYKNV